jgi:hypothetical protein
MVRIGLALGFLVLVTQPAFSQTVSLANGDFEAGTLTGWTASGINDGTATLVRAGTCFSYNNTQGLTIGGKFAANVRSSASAPTDSVGILTSDPFVAGSSVSFNTLSELDDKKASEVFSDPVTFEVRLLDALDNVLLSQVLKTKVVTLNHSGTSCGGESRDAAFSNHVIDTSGFRGQIVKLQFRQHTNVPEWGYFTLVDDVRTSPENPTISLDLVGCIRCYEGGRIVVRARIINPRSDTVRVEVKAGGTMPDGTAVNLLGDEHLELTLQPGTDRVFTLVDRPLPNAVTPGTWTVEGTLLEPALGKTLSRDATRFEVSQ